MHLIFIIGIILFDMLLFYTLELVFSIITIMVFILKSTNGCINLKHFVMTVTLIIIPLYFLLVYLDVPFILTPIASYTIPLFSINNLTKKRIIYLVTLLQAIVFSITSITILVESFFIQDTIYNSIVDLLIILIILAIVVCLRKEYMYEKINSFLVFIPIGLKILIIFSFYMISFLSADLSYIPKTEFTNHIWYYVLECTFILSLIAFCIIYPLLISSFTSKNYYKKISEIANEQSKQQFEYYNNLVNKEQFLREFRHDYKNQLIVLEAYLKKEDIESARNYIVKSFDLLNETSGIQTGNYILDVLITEKQQKAGSISIEFKGKMTSKFVEPIDICTIFGNALDNAIEACQKIDASDQRIIRISIQESINTLHISISNPVKSKVNIVNNNILTTKEDNTNHGLGLFSIKKVAKKYKGKVAITCDDDVFSLSILLINSKKF